MKPIVVLLSFRFCLAAATALMLANCASSPKSKSKKRAAAAADAALVAGGNGGGDSSAAAGIDALDDYGDDDLDDYAAIEVSDPLEPLNRATFKLNDGIYNVLFRPISKGYEIIVPRFLRTGITNVFENAKFPVRLVNCGLQGKFRRAGLETGKFAVNTVAGLGGLIRMSDRVPGLANVPEEDAGQTFATWGIGHGPYLVLPVLGPSSVREGVGYAFDYVMSPVNWGMFQSKDSLKYIPPSANTVRALPDQLSTYDAVSRDAIDPYISTRSTYIQNRAAAVRE